MSLEEFVKTYNGKKVDFDNAFDIAPHKYSSDIPAILEYTG